MHDLTNVWNNKNIIWYLVLVPGESQLTTCIYNINLYNHILRPLFTE